MKSSSVSFSCLFWPVGQLGRRKKLERRCWLGIGYWRDDIWLEGRGGLPGWVGFSPNIALNVRSHSPPMAQRVTLRKRTPYNTTSNRRRVVKTPGGKLVYHHLKKLATSPKCGDCGIALPGVCISTSLRRAVSLTSNAMSIGPCPAPPSIRHHLQDEEDCSQGVRWLTMR